MGRVARLGLSVALAMTAAGCGGGGSGNGGTVVTTPSPTPTPSNPVPQPTTFAAGGALPYAGFAMFDVNQNGFADTGELQLSTDPYGVFGVGGTLPRVFALPESVPPAGTPVFFRGINTVDGYRVGGLTAPAGAAVVSPLSTVLSGSLDQAARERLATSINLTASASTLLSQPAALEPAGWTNSLRPDPALARSIRAYNLKLLAFGLFTVADPVNGEISFAEPMGAVRDVLLLAEGRSVALDTSATLVGVLDRIGNGRFAATSGRDAAVGLIQSYMRAIDIAMASEDGQEAGIEIAARIIVAPELRALQRDASPAAIARASNLSVNRMVELFRSLRPTSRWSAQNNDRIILAPDYVSMPAGPDGATVTLAGCGVSNQHVTCNDTDLGGTDITRTTARVTLVGGPVGQETELNSRLNADGSITLFRLTDRVAFFRLFYQLTAADGKTYSGAIHVRVNDSL